MTKNQNEMTKNEYRNLVTLVGFFLLFAFLSLCLFVGLYISTNNQYPNLYLKCDELNPHLTSTVSKSLCISKNSTILIHILECNGDKTIEVISNNQTWQGWKACWYFTGEIHCDEFVSNVLKKLDFRVEFSKPQGQIQLEEYNKCVTKLNNINDERMTYAIVIIISSSLLCGLFFICMKLYEKYGVD